MTGMTALLLGFLIAFSAHAQTVGDQRPDRTITSNMPTQSGNAMADLPAVVYRSALSGYRPFRDEKISSWQASNDNVARAGGWRAYAREVREPESAPRDTPAAGHPHAGHGK